MEKSEFLKKYGHLVKEKKPEISSLAKAVLQKPEMINELFNMANMTGKSPLDFIVENESMSLEEIKKK